MQSSKVQRIKNVSAKPEAKDSKPINAYLVNGMVNQISLATKEGGKI